MKKFYDYGRAIAALEVLVAYGQAESAVVLKSAAIIREYLDANPVDHAGVDSGQLTVDNEKPKLGVFNEEVEAALAALTKVLRNRPDPIATFVGPALSDKKPVEIPKSNPSDEAGEAPKRANKPVQAKVSARKPVSNKPATPEELDKFKKLVKLAQQTNANTIPLVIKLAGRNGLGKAALERAMRLPSNAICNHFNKPSPRVESTFAEHFGWEVAE